jgi:lipid II:glycine glycyltransferase (peptidoglycan interpeptide bridge formation enzyme)
LEKKKVYVKEISQAKEIAKVYGILSQTYSKVQVPIADISLFEKAHEYLYRKGMVKFLIAKLNEENIATLVALLFKKTILTWYYGNSAEYNRLSGASLLIWHLIKWGASNGYEILDFGGAGRPNEKYGVRDYKARFGGQKVNYGRYMKVHSPVMLQLAKTGYQIYRKLL